MTKPIRLFALSKSGIISTDIDGDPNGRNLMVFVDEAEATTSRLDGEEIVELAEIRRCGTCLHYNPRPLTCGHCHFWSAGTIPDGFCHNHRHEVSPDVPTAEQADHELREAGVDVDAFEARLRDKIKTAKEKTGG